MEPKILINNVLPELPSQGTLKRNAIAAFKEYSQALLDEWHVRQKSPSIRRAESPNAWFKREAYRLLVYYVERDLTGVFSTIAKQDKRPSKLVQEANKNPFKLGLLAMFADESPLSRTNRHVFSIQMLYAWYHDVPPEFLNGFLAVSGGHGIISAKLKDGVVEEGFEKRFKPQRRLA